MSSWMRVIYSPLLLNNLIACAISLTAIGAGLVFLGYIESAMLRKTFPGARELLLNCIMSGLAFAVIVALGYRREVSGAVLGAILGVSLGSSYWCHAAITAMYWNARNGAHPYLGRIFVGCLFSVIYVLPLIPVGVIYLIVIAAIEACILIPGLILSRLLQTELPLSLPISWLNQAILLLIPYIAGTVLIFVGKDVITYAFEPSVMLLHASAALYLFGWIGSSFYIITMRIVRWQQSPTELQAAISWLNVWKKLWRWWPRVYDWYGRRISEYTKRYETIVEGQKHQAYLQFASLVGGLATGLGFGSLPGPLSGPALGLNKRIVFGVEIFLAPTLLGMLEGKVANRKMSYQLARLGLITLLSAITTIVLLYFVPLPD